MHFDPNSNPTPTPDLESQNSLQDQTAVLCVAETNPHKNSYTRRTNTHRYRQSSRPDKISMWSTEDRIFDTGDQRQEQQHLTRSDK